MKKFALNAFVFGAAFLFSSCEVVEGIFKAGMVGGILIVVLIVALVFWLIRKMRG